MCGVYDVVLVIFVPWRNPFSEFRSLNHWLLMDSRLEEEERFGRVRCRGVVDVQEALVEEQAFHCGCEHACVALLSACFRFGNHSFARSQILRT